MLRKIGSMHADLETYRLNHRKCVNVIDRVSNMIRNKSCWSDVFCFEHHITVWFKSHLIWWCSLFLYCPFGWLWGYVDKKDRKKKDTVGIMPSKGLPITGKLLMLLLPWLQILVFIITRAFSDITRAFSNIGWYLALVLQSQANCWHCCFLISGFVLRHHRGLFQHWLFTLWVRVTEHANHLVCLPGCRSLGNRHL